MAEINLREAAARRVGALPQLPADSTRTLFTDGASPGKGDVGKLKNQPLAPKDITDASIESSSPSKEYNVYNRLNHLEMICGYDVKYFITPTALTHAASVFRHIAFGDISDIIRKAQEYIAQQKQRARKLLEDMSAIAIKTQSTIPKDSALQVGGDVPPEYKYLDQFNVPWDLRVPKEGTKDLIKTLGASDIIEIDDQLSSKGLVENKSFPLSLEVDVGREMYNCPQKPMVKGAFYLGKITRPIFIPVKAGLSYGGIFGKWFSEAKQIIVSKGSSFGAKLKSTSALAANRMVLPTKIDESSNSALVSLPILSDFANIVNVPLIYSEKDNKDYVSYIDTKVKKTSIDDSTKVELDSEWKRVISSGDLFYDSTNSPQYSKTGLVPNTIIKHGTKNLTVEDLEKSVSEVADKIVSPILSRASIKVVSKAGETAAKIDNESPKTLDQFSTLKVKEYIKEKDWQDIISSKLLNAPRWKGGLKNGSNIRTYSDLPSFFFWSPVLSYMGKESDGSIVYGYAEPSEDTQFNEMQILYYETPPYAELKFGVERKRWDSPQIYSSENVDAYTEDNIAPFLDPDILAYGLGGYENEKYHVPVSSLVKNVSLMKTFSFSTKERIFDKNYRLGGSDFDIYSEILSRISANFGAINSDLSSTVSDVLSEPNYTKLMQKSISPIYLSASINDLLLVTTDSETIDSDSTSYFVSSDREVLLTKSKAVAKIILGSLKEAKIHFGKEVNKEAAKSNQSISNVLIDATVKQTPLFNPEDNSFVIDVQPGEVLYSVDQDIKYVTDSFVPGSCIDESSLLSKEFSQRPGILDLVFSFLSPEVAVKKGSGEDNSKENISQKPVEQLKLKDIAFSMNVARLVLFGKSNILDTPSSKIELGQLLPSFYADKVANSTGPFYTSLGGLYGNFMFSCITSDHFYSELVDDYKKSIAALLGLAFTRSDRNETLVEITTTSSQKVIGAVVSEGSEDTDSITIEILNPNGTSKTEKYSYSQISSMRRFVIPSTRSEIFSSTIKEYFTVSGNSLTFNPNPEESHSSLEYNYVPTNVSFIPWSGFLSGDGKIQEGSSPYKKFEIRDPSEFIELFVNNINYSYSSLESLVSTLIKEISTTTDSRNPIKKFIGLATKDKQKFETFVSQSSNLIWIKGLMSNQFGLSASLVDTISGGFSDLLLSSVKGSLFALLSNPDNVATVWGGESVPPTEILYPLGTSSEDSETVNSEFLSSIASNYNLLSNSSLFSISEFTSVGNSLGVDYNGTPQEKQALTVAVFCIAGIILDSILKDERLQKLLKEGVDQYYIYASKLSSEGVSSVPTYEVRDATPLLGFLKELSNSIISGKSRDEGFVMSDSFSRAKSFLSSWMYNEGERIVVPGDSSIKIPLCLVEQVEGTDEYSVIDHTKSYKYEDFVKNIEDGKWVYLFKVLEPAWLGGETTANLNAIRKTATHAAFTMQLLDMIGFVGQAVIENSRTIKSIELTEKVSEDVDPKKVRIDKLVASSIYYKDNFSLGDTISELVSDKGINIGSFSSKYDREMLVPLKDFTNMVKVSKDSSAGIKFTRMYPVVLKDLNSEDLRNGITISSIVGKTSLDLSFLNDPTANRMASVFLRPGYGYPDIVKNLGYRCIIKNFDTFARGKVDNKRFAFHGKWKKDQASLFSDRMLQQAVNSESWDKIVKSSEWTASLLSDKSTSIGTSIFGMEVPNSYLSKFDNPKLDGLSKTAIFDIEFGYLSSRPVFAQVIKINAPKYSGVVQFISKSVSKKINYQSNYPSNLGIALTENFLNRKRGNITKTKDFLGSFVKKVKPQNPNDSLVLSLLTLVGCSLEEGVVHKTLGDLASKNVSRAGDDLYFTAAFGVPRAYEKSDSEILTKSISNSHTFANKKSKVVEMINSDKLRDVSFINNSEFVLTGKTYTSVPLNQGAYPFLPVGTKLRTFSGNTSAELADYNSISPTGNDYENLIDFHPLSFLTSPTTIGLSKRRAVIYGSGLFASILSSYTFYKDPEASNPFAGIYVKKPSKLSFSQEDVPLLRQSGRKGFLKDGKITPPSYMSVIVIPDFPSTNSDIRSIFSSYLSGVTNIDENISNRSLMSFFGVGPYLNGEYVEKGAKRAVLIPSDTSGPHNLESYNSKNVLLVSQLLNKYYEAAKKSTLYGEDSDGEEDETIFPNLVSGAVFPNDLNTTKEVEEYISDNSLSSVVIKLDVDEDSSAKVNKILTSLPIRTSSYKPYYFDEKEAVLYYTVSFVSYLNNLRYVVKKGDKVKKSDIEFLLELITATSGLLYMDESSCKSDIDIVYKVDIYSLLAGVKMKRTSGSVPVRLSVLEETKETSQIEVDFAIASKVYIGPSKTLEGEPVHVAVTNVSVGNVIKGGLNGLTCTRVFGQGLKICGNPDDSTTLLSETLKNVPSFISRKENIIGNKKSPTNLLVSKKIDSHFTYTSAVNRILLARAELKLRYLKDRFGDPSVKTYMSESKPISELTLNELVYVPSEYFLKEVGPKLKSYFSESNKSKNLIPFIDFFGEDDYKKLTCVKKIGNNVHMVFPGPSGSGNKIKGYSDPNSTTLLGISFEPEKPNYYTTVPVQKDVEQFDKKVLAALWSLFAAKMFFAVDNVGVELSEEEIEKAQIEVGDLGRVKPQVTPLGPGMLRVYADIDSYDVFERREGNGNYIIRFRSKTVQKAASLELQWEQVSVGFKGASELSPTSFSLAESDTKMSSKFKQTASIVASTNGVRIIKFGMVGVTA